MAKNAKRKPYVYYTTIWKSVGGGLSNPGESKVCKVGKHKLLLSRAQRLDYYGNPVHTASVIYKDGSIGGTYRGNGSASLIAEKALQRSGVGVKRKKRNVRK